MGGGELTKPPVVETLQTVDRCQEKVSFLQRRAPGKLQWTAQPPVHTGNTNWIQWFCIYLHMYYIHICTYNRKEDMEVGDEGRNTGSGG